MSDTEERDSKLLENMRQMFTDMMENTKTDILTQVQGSIEKIYEDMDQTDESLEQEIENMSLPESSHSLAQKVEKFADQVASQGGKAKDESFKALAEEFSVSEKTGPAIDAGLADIINSLLKDKLPKEKLSGLQEKYLRPANCPTLVAPKINKQVWQQLHQESRNADSSFQKAQSLLISGLNAIIQLCNKAEGEQKATLTHSVVLLLASNRELNMKRRELIRPDLNKQYAALCNPSTAVSTFLFGDDLNKEVEDLTKSNKLSSKVTARQRVEPYKVPRGRGSRSSQGKFDRFPGKGKGPRSQAPFLGVGRGRGRPLQSTKPQQSKTQ